MKVHLGIGLAVVAVVLGMASVAGAQSEVAGSWVLTAVDDAGTTTTNQMELEVQGEAVTGTIVPPEGEAFTLEGTVKDGEVRFRLTGQAGGYPFTRSLR